MVIVNIWIGWRFFFLFLDFGKFFFCSAFCVLCWEYTYVKNALRHINIPVGGALDTHTRARTHHANPTAWSIYPRRRPYCHSRYRSISIFDLYFCFPWLVYFDLSKRIKTNNNNSQTQTTHPVQSTTQNHGVGSHRWMGSWLRVLGNGRMCVYSPTIFAILIVHVHYCIWRESERELSLCLFLFLHLDFHLMIFAYRAFFRLVSA